MSRDPGVAERSGPPGGGRPGSAAHLSAGGTARVLKGIGRAVLVPISRVVDVWRRSIQARVAIGTLLLSTVLTALAGWILLRQVAGGVLDSKRQGALTQA